LAEQADRFDPPALVYVIAVLEDLRRQVRFSTTARALADAAMVRLSSLQNFADISRLLGELDAGSQAASAPAMKPPTQKKSPEPAQARPAAMTPPTAPRPSGPRPSPRPTATPAEPVGVGRKVLDEVMRDPLVKEVMEKFEASPMSVEQADTSAPSE
jgi:hypothetical protein